MQDATPAREVFTRLQKIGIGAVAVAEGDLPGGRRFARGQIEKGVFLGHAPL